MTLDEKPSPANPYFYRAEDRLYLLGIECINPCGIELGIYTDVDPDTCDLDEEFPLPTELIPILQRYVMDLGRFVLMMPNDRINEGNADMSISNVPKSKLISVNALTTDNQQQMQAQAMAAQQQQTA